MKKATGLSFCTKSLLYRGKEDREMSRLPKAYLLVAAIITAVMLLSPLAFAGSTGKIKGVVTDKASGEPIPGASVQIVGTTQGAVTDPKSIYEIPLLLQ